MEDYKAKNDLEKWANGERKNNNVENFKVMTSNFFKELVIGPIRNELKLFVLNGNLGNSTYRVYRTHIP